MKHLFLFFTIVFSTLIIVSCSEIREDLPQAPEITLHKSGFSTPGSSDFHGKLIANSNWDMKQCQQCHASNYNGGTAQASCYDCHKLPGGPEACNTCHGDFVNPLKQAPPRALNGAISSSERGVGAHSKHLSDNIMGVAVECTECHTMPNGFSDPIHIDNTLGAEVVFGDFAKLNTNIPSGFSYDAGLGDFNPNPTFNFEAGSCSNTYCNGYFKSGNTNNVVLFTAQSQGSACGTCHGDPTTGNPMPKTPAEGGTHPPNANCETCHLDEVSIINGVYSITDKSKHINGKLNIFGNEETY